MTAWLANLMNLPGKTDRVITEEDSPGLVQEIPREVMDSTLCKLSITVHSSKTVCKNTPRCGSLTAFY